MDMSIPLPGLPSFDYIRADSPEQVTELLLNHSNEARLLMGGTDIFVQMRDGVVEPKLLVDVKHLPGMTDIEFNADSGLNIGAAANMNTVARHPAVMENYPLLVEAANAVASYQLRNRATIGGNLCNASPAADTAPAILALEASLIVQGEKGERSIPATAFFQGPGENALRKGEFLTRIEIPIPPVGWKGRYLKLGRNKEGDLAIVGVAVMGFPDPSAQSNYGFRIALASVAPTPIRVPQAEQILAGSSITDDTIKEAAEAALEAGDPIDDVRATARYRREMVRVFTRRGIQAVWAMLREEG
jgi:CO/xanthine dehydrogenase FAD-binding subunit